MWWKSKKPRLIRVLFVDADSGACFAVTDSPPEYLPDSFAEQTTVTIEDQDWRVLAAEPVTRAEFEKKGELRLTLEKVSARNVSPHDILFSLPTLCDATPPLAPGTTKHGNVLELHEDDWRQVELVARSQGVEVCRCLGHIDRIYAEERTPGGAFRQLHVRTEVAEPLPDSRLRLEEVRAAFGARLTAFDGLGYRQAAGLIDGGFAFASASGLHLYGQEQAGRVAVLGLLGHGLRGDVIPDSEALATLMGRHGLDLVDWCAVRQVPSGDLTDYLRSRGAG